MTYRPTDGPPCATPLIRGFYRDHRDQWSRANVYNAVGRLNKVERWLVERGSTLATATTDELRDYLHERTTEIAPRSGQPLSRNTVIVDQRQLRAFYAYLAEEGIRSDNPARATRKIKPAAVDETRCPEVEEWQYRALLATTAKRRTRVGTKRCNDLRDAAIITLLWDTGLRRSELCVIEYRHIDWENETIYLAQTKGKSKTRSRHIVPGPEAWKHLQRYISAPESEGGRGERPGPLFESTHRLPGTDRRQALTPQSITLLLTRRAKVANETQSGLPGVVHAPAHAFRRTSTMNDIDAGMTPRTIQILKGWDEEDGRMFGRYSKKRRTRQAIDEARRIKNGERHLWVVEDAR